MTIWCALKPENWLPGRFFKTGHRPHSLQWLSIASIVSAYFSPEIEINSANQPQVLIKLACHFGLRLSTNGCIPAKNTKESRVHRELTLWWCLMAGQIFQLPPLSVWQAHGLEPKQVGWVLCEDPCVKLECEAGQAKGIHRFSHFQSWLWRQYPCLVQR